MNKQISKSQIIRFRRWCRKGYAIFCSLGKTVAIGNLRKGIVEASLKKQPGVCLLSVLCRPDRVDEEDDKAPDREVADRILSLIILEIITVNRLRCAIVESYCLLYLYGRKNVKCVLSGFFYVINRSRNDAEQT